MESEFGIAGFVSDFPGFSCVIKQRYQDFLVREIDEDGRVVRLTSLEASGDARSNQQGRASEKADVCALWNAEINEHLEALADGKRDDSVSISCQDFEKSRRAEIHHAIRERFPNLQSATCSNEKGVPVITVTKAVPGQSSRKRCYWPSERKGDYVRFVLYKENKDSHFALALISRLLGMKPSNISLAGTKDRRAVTSQLATIYRVSAEKLAALNRQLRGIKLGNFDYCEDQLHLGQSKGNRFTVVMRNVQASEELVEEGIRKLLENGFVNFFGTQRFGTSSVPTHAVGKAILRKQWDDVVDLLLSPKEESHSAQYVVECCRVWASTRNPAEALAAIPSRRRHTSLEGLLLSGLKKHGLNDFQRAFSLVPRNSRTLYVHSFQSFVWNKLVSKRLAKHGRALLVGDHIAPDDSGDVRILTENESKTAEPFQLRIPLPSADVEFANIEMRDWFDEILTEEGVCRDDFRGVEKEYAVHGGFRRIFVKPSEVEYRFYRYNDHTAPLASTDYDILQSEPEPESVANGTYSALSLSFSLPTGSYATMAVRELCRIDTGKQYQSSLNDYASADDTDADSLANEVQLDKAQVDAS